ncbi:diguanylate cyclase [Anaerobacillus sp. HL2]|nr:diguanylate cyclase [Anaerobacillus sp. HL2]
MKLNEELQDINQFLQQLSMFDGLTGISNRRKFDEYCQSEWNRMHRTKNYLYLLLW